MENLRDLADAELVSIINKGNTEAFGEIYNRYSIMVYNKCISICQDHIHSQDLTHDIFLKCFLNLRSFSNNSKFSTWLYSITYNYCIDDLRKKKLIQQNPFIDASSLEQSDLLIEEEEFDSHVHDISPEKLNVFLNQIPVNDKIILLMKYQDNLSIKDISKILDLGESAVKMRISRAKKILIQKIKLN